MLTSGKRRTNTTVLHAARWQKGMQGSVDSHSPQVDNMLQSLGELQVAVILAMQPPPGGPQVGSVGTQVEPMAAGRVQL